MIIEKLYRELLPLYEQLYVDCARLKDKRGNTVDLKEFAAFLPRIGNAYPEAERKGILFVGRAPNGGESRMEFPADRVIKDQLKMRENFYLEGKSPILELCANGGFKKVMSTVSSAFYPNNWFEHIAWTNLYKVAPATEGNPGAYLKLTERETCKKILKKEIELLSPKYVIFITGWKDWFEDFSSTVKMPSDAGQIVTENWVATKRGTILPVKKWVANDITYILCDRPERRKSDNLIAAICKLMQG